MRRNSVIGPAPSIRAASRTSSEIPWSPASKISIMNGAHCQTAMAMIENFGWTASQSIRWLVRKVVNPDPGMPNRGRGKNPAGEAEQQGRTERGLGNQRKVGGRSKKKAKARRALGPKKRQRPASTCVAGEAMDADGTV